MFTYILLIFKCIFYVYLQKKCKQYSINTRTSSICSGLFCYEHKYGIFHSNINKKINISSLSGQYFYILAIFFPKLASLHCCEKSLFFSPATFACLYDKLLFYLENNTGIDVVFSFRIPGCLNGFKYFDVIGIHSQHKIN